MESGVDMFNTPIKEGDSVVFPYYEAYGPKLRIGTVFKITPKGVRVQFHTPTKRKDKKPTEKKIYIYGGVIKVPDTYLFMEM